MDIAKLASPSLGFAYYVQKWGNYNKLYGSLGAIIITMLWLYFNSMMLIIGHEFNKSLTHTHMVITRKKGERKRMIEK